MSVEDNKALVRLLVEDIFINRKFENASRYFVTNSMLAGGIVNLSNEFSTGFPDVQFSVDDLLADSDKVILRFTLQGKNTGPFLGNLPTGKSMAATGIHIYQIRDGRIVTAWLEYDLFATMQQLGLLPMSDH